MVKAGQILFSIEVVQLGTLQKKWSQIILTQTNIASSFIASAILLDSFPPGMYCTVCFISSIPSHTTFIPYTIWNVSFMKRTDEFVNAWWGTCEFATWLDRCYRSGLLHLPLAITPHFSEFHHVTSVSSNAKLVQEGASFAQL